MGELEDLNMPILPTNFGRMDGSGDRANVIEQTDPEVFVSNIKHTLAGEEFDSEKEQWVKIMGYNPILNEMGINNIGVFMKLLITKNTIFTKYSEQQMRPVLIMLEKDINHHLRANARNYEIAPENYGALFNMIVQPIESAMKRSQDGFNAGFIGDMTRQINTNSEMVRPMYFPEKREGIISKTINKFNPFK